MDLCVHFEKPAFIVLYLLYICILVFQIPPSVAVSSELLNAAYINQCGPVEMLCRHTAGR